MRLRLDPWAAEYNTAYHAENTEANSDRTPIDNPDIEYDTWQVVEPQQTEVELNEVVDLPELIFIDGSRRIEARGLLETDSGESAFAALGTYAIGAVKCCAKQSKAAEFVDIEEAVGIQSINRLCTISADGTYDDFKIEAVPNVHLGSLSYNVHVAETTDSDSVMRKLQFVMLDQEEELATRLQEAYPNALIVRDGPRRGSSKSDHVIGYVKTVHELRLDPTQLDIVRQLKEGQRSPIYTIKADGSQTYFEWFLRLRDPTPWLYSLAGMVRLQALAGPMPENKIESTKHLADWLCYKLPRFATRQHQDPRAPQQLLPIRALESELRRGMGNSQIVRRRIMQHLSKPEAKE